MIRKTIIITLLTMLVIILIGALESCSSVKRLRNRSFETADSVNVHSSNAIAISKSGWNDTETTHNDYDILEVQTPKDTSHTSLDGSYKNATIVFNDKKIIVPEGSTLKFEKGTLTQEKKIATSNFDSSASSNKDSTDLSKQTKNVSANTDSNRFSLPGIIGLTIIGILALCLWDLHKKKNPLI